MSGSISPLARRRYALARVCSVWDFPRSTFYAQAAPPADPLLPPLKTNAKRGPKTALDDDALLALIRADLAASPFIGEGHRKVHARLHFVAGYQLGRNRVLALIRAARLLSPHRAPSAALRAPAPSAASCRPPAASSCATTTAPNTSPTSSNPTPASTALLPALRPIRLRSGHPQAQGRVAPRRHRHLRPPLQSPLAPRKTPLPIPNPSPSCLPFRPAFSCLNPPIRCPSNRARYRVTTGSRERSGSLGSIPTSWRRSRR